MDSRSHHSLLLVTSFSFLVLFNCGCSLDAGASPESAPVSVPDSAPVSSPDSAPAPAPIHPLNYVSFPPNSEAPSEQAISPSSKGSLPLLAEEDYDYPLDANPPSPQEEVDEEEEAAPASAPGAAEPPSDTLPPSEQPISPSADADPSLKSVCDNTDYPELCLSTVSPLINGKADLMSVLETTMKISSDFAKTVSGEVKKAADAPGTDPKLAKILKDCQESYDNALTNFEKAIGAFPARDIGTMNTMLSAVLTDIGDCEDSLSDSGTSSPLSGSADKLTNMTSNCLAIISQLNI